MVYGNDDIPTMLEWGNEISAGEIVAPCVLDDSEEEALEQAGGGGQIIRKIVAIVRSSDFPDLGNNDPVEVDGVAYIIWRRLRLGDGALSELWLRLAEES